VLRLPNPLLSLLADQVLERPVLAEQAEADLAAIRNMWELAAVYEFMSTFKHWLNFTQLYPLHDLEEAIVKSPGPGECLLTAATSTALLVVPDASAV
jgi:hypothetical protein